MRKEVSELPGCKAKVISMSSKRKIFQNWVWVEQGKVARSSAPYYDKLLKSDAHSVDADVIWYLKTQGINTVISLNNAPLKPHEQDSLKNNGIDYVHFKIPDYQPPTREQLNEGVSLMCKPGSVSLVFCGFGAGRTGTMITAYEIMVGGVGNRKKTREQVMDESTAEEDSQEAVLNTLSWGCMSS